MSRPTSLESQQLMYEQAMRDMQWRGEIDVDEAIYMTNDIRNWTIPPQRQ